MWNTTIFLGELIGTLFLTLMATIVVLSSKSEKLNIQPEKRNIYNAVLIGVVLMISIIVCLGIENKVGGKVATGFVNPAAALMRCISIANYDMLLPSLAGEFSGALIGGIIPLVIFWVKARNDEQANQDLDEAYGMPCEKTPIKITIFSEFIGSSIFIGVIAAAILVAGPLTPVFVGLGIMIVIITFGLRSVLVLNPAAFLMPMLVYLFKSRPKNNSAAAINIIFGILTNMAVAAMIGGIYSLLTLI